ncbi:MAG TPA: murein L,D-transpeptidase catalytic domain family protein [Thermoanaerobaculia bacterium]
MRQSAAIFGSLALVFVLSGAADSRPATAVAAPARASVSAAAPVVPGIAADTAGRELEAEVTSALEALSRFVATSSHPDALRSAFHAYFAFKADNPGRVRKPYLYFVDYGLSNSTRRGYVFDMETLALVDGPFTVAHGRGSSRGRNGVPSRFSNRPGSAMTSLGLYVTQETYGFVGHAGGRTYRSVGLRLQGVSGDFNDAARSRGVVAHGAPYMSARDAGRSEGCPALEERRAQRLLPMIANGALVFLYSPNDSVWLDQDPWVNG